LYLLDTNLSVLEDRRIMYAVEEGAFMKGRCID
jgi:hypothetical protein